MRVLRSRLYDIGAAGTAGAIAADRAARWEARPEREDPDYNFRKTDH